MQIAPAIANWDPFELADLRDVIEATPLDGDRWTPVLGRRIREAAGLGQEAVAQAAGVARMSVSRWESGARTPYTEHLQRETRILEDRVEVVQAADRRWTGAGLRYLRTLQAAEAALLRWLRSRDLPAPDDPAFEAWVEETCGASLERTRRVVGALRRAGVTVGELAEMAGLSVEWTWEVLEGNEDPPGRFLDALRTLAGVGGSQEVLGETERPPEELVPAGG